METPPNPNAVEGKPSEVSLGAALLTYFGLFALALLATYPDARALPGALLFPVGLGAALRASPKEAGAPLIYFGAYGLYVALFIGLMAARHRRGGFLCVAGVLAFCLMLNVTGCHAMLGH